MHQSIKYNSEEELVIRHLDARDHLLVGIDSQDIWLKIYLTLNSSEEKCFHSEFEIKIDNNMIGKDLKFVMQKLSISIWNKLYRETVNKNQI
jgi:hypothetical protein